MSHPHMVFDLEECEQLSSLQKKTTFVITTSQAHINCLMWSVFSVMLRSKVGGFVAHLNVAINGPDKRTGDPTLQDQKQAFLEELRSLSWKNKPEDQGENFPLTVIRVWSRIGAEQSLEMAVPWVHTDSYIYLHDDAIWLAKDWEETLMAELYKDKVAILHAQDFKLNPVAAKTWQGRPKLNFPHTHSACMAVRKPALAKSGVRWTGYHFENEFELEKKLADMESFLNVHQPNVLPLPSNLVYASASYDIGSWVYYKLRQDGYSILPSSVMRVHHFGSMSWFVQRPQNASLLGARVAAAKRYVDSLEEEIKTIPEYWALYQKYKTEI